MHAQAYTCRCTCKFTHAHARPKLRHMCGQTTRQDRHEHVHNQNRSRPCLHRVPNNRAIRSLHRCASLPLIPYAIHRPLKRSYGATSFNCCAVFSSCFLSCAAAGTAGGSPLSFTPSCCRLSLLRTFQHQDLGVIAGAHQKRKITAENGKTCSYTTRSCSHALSYTLQHTLSHYHTLESLPPIMRWQNY